MTDSKNPESGKKQQLETGPASGIKTSLKHPLRTGTGDSGQGSGKDRVLPQRHLAFRPMPRGSVIRKSLAAKVVWALLEQENSPKLSPPVTAAFLPGP